MASPFQRRLAIKLTNRSPSFTKPHRIKIIPPLCLYSSSSSHSKGKASESKITGLAAAFGCLGMVGLVGVAFGMSARSQQQVVRQEQRMFSTNVDQKTSSGSDQSSLAALNEEPENPSDSSSQQSAFNPETGEINWDCPCLGGMAHGVCGEQFKAAFGCFVYSDAEPKGVECIDKFKLMQDCFKEHPDVYGEELIGQDEDQQPDEDQGQTESEHTSRTLTAPTPPSGPEESLSLTVPSPEPDITLPASRLPKADQPVPTNQPAATTLTSDQRSEN